MILYQHRNYVLINKPAGWVTERNPWETSVEAWLEDHLRKQITKPYVGVVHRLDRVTSGVLLMATKKSALRHFNAAFRDGNVRKTYHAIVAQRPPEEHGTLRHFHEKDQKNKRARLHRQTGPGRQPVELTYTLRGAVERGFLLEIRPATGKFHQIRVQLADIGCPIVGDEKYGSTQAYRDRAILLHASELHLPDPSGKWQQFKAPLPDPFR